MICTGGTISPDLFDLSQLGDALENKQQQKKTPHSFLGENSSLVNLDNLVTVSKPPSMAPSPGKNSRSLFYLTSHLISRIFRVTFCQMIFPTKILCSCLVCPFQQAFSFAYIKRFHWIWLWNSSIHLQSPMFLIFFNEKVSATNFCVNFMFLFPLNIC